MFTTLACISFEQPPIMYISILIFQSTVFFICCATTIITIIKFIQKFISRKKIFDHKFTTQIILFLGLLSSFSTNFLFNEPKTNHWDNYWINYLIWGITFAILWWFQRDKTSQYLLLFIKIVSILLLVLSLTIYVNITFFPETKTNNKLLENKTNIPTTDSRFFEPLRSLNSSGCGGSSELRWF